MKLGSTPQQLSEDNWRLRLDKFVKAHHQELAALAWGLFLEKGESDDTLGIDLKPKPHFIYCPREAIEKLNNKVDNQLQEILGFVDAHKPEQEVLLIGVSSGHLKLVQFKSEPAPPDCYQQVGKSVDNLLESLEQLLSEEIGDLC
ncbi:MAG: hypothetical protein F6J89_03385 [Symploca sp. SIO1C4]|uniref:Chaperone protein CcmS domain-containing protein n=1 Tax=Symploca sp. SIO1C4 TaxID=2607765 RepID=A0A6B3N7T3_9CYAN|nr:hypothetical protein [Symploca sp. SIO1C4]